MASASSFKAVGAGLLWKYGRFKAAGRMLVKELSSDDPNAQTVAGTFLVQAGERSRPLIEDGLARGESGLYEQVLADLEDDDDGRLEELAQSDNPKVADAARSMLEQRKRETGN